MKSPSPIVMIMDGREVRTKEGRTVLEAALDAGIYIPHLCHHPDLRPVGSCGLCIVEIKGTEGPQPSCMTPAADRMIVHTKTSRVDRLRRLAMELLLADHPAECLSCSQYLNCELQSVKQYLGITEELSVRRRTRQIPVRTDNPLFVHDFARCIRCGRCVRACNELRGIGVLSFIGQGQETRVGTAFDRSLAEAGCRFCGACVEVCPTGAIRDREELVKGRKRRHALVPCRYDCPAEIDVPRYVRLVRAKKYSEATAVIREKVPFPKVLGHVCHHPCENGCRRKDVNQPIAIRDLKRIAAERDTQRLWEQNARIKPPTGKRVAVVGSGPAGLTSAACLAKAGHSVTVFDENPEPGGMMRYGIPAYRLPREVLAEEIGEILKLGVTLCTGTRVESIENLMEGDDFDAVVVAVGTHEGRKLPIQGSGLTGVLDALTFLKSVNSGEAVTVGRRIVVLGGGNVAFDCARVARRLGADNVTIVCLEKKGKMPAACDEIQEGEAEGILVMPGRTVTRILESGSRAAGVESLEVDSFSFDEDGRVDMTVVEGSEQVIEADTIFFAIGQRPKIPEDFDIDLDGRGLIEMDSYTLETSIDGVFAAGDTVTGSASVIQAIASGRKAAMAVDRYLGGDGEIGEVLVKVEAPDAWMGPDPEFAGQSRCSGECIGVEERIGGFQCLTETLGETEAAREAARCLQCDLRLTITPVRFWGDY
ncbi:MAG: FAD-dependent oxidoreductase [Pseudomonadota bacterium]